jgi:molybdate transport system substrate-binding protein
MQVRENGLNVRGLSTCVRSCIAALFMMAQCHTAQSAEITVFSVLPLKPFLTEFGPEFERATGHKLTISYDVSAALKRQIDAGAAFDVALLLPALIDELVKQGRVAPGTSMDVSRAAVGVAIRKGASRPDIGSTAAFRRTLLDAKSIAYSSEGGSGAYFKSVLDRLGIAAEVSSALKPMASSAVVPAVAGGEVQLAVISPPAILADPGVELVGILPPELQNYVVYTAGISAASRDAGAGKALLAYLTTPKALAVMKAKGLEPVAP